MMRRHGRKPWTFFVTTMLLVALIFSVTGCARVIAEPTITPKIAPWPQPAPLAKSERAQESLPTARRPLNKRCSQDIGQFVPVRLVIEQVGIDDPLTAQSQDANKALPVPIASFATTGSWWQDGAMPGGDGAAYIGVHTYSAKVDATGNKLLRVKTGAVAKLYDASGAIGACYVFYGERLNGSLTVVPPEAYRVDGFPGLTIMTCDGFDPKTREFTIRAYYLWSRIWSL